MYLSDTQLLRCTTDSTSQHDITTLVLSWGFTFNPALGYKEVWVFVHIHYALFLELCNEGRQPKKGQNTANGKL
jgi:hypothetical protein